MSFAAQTRQRLLVPSVLLALVVVTLSALVWQYPGAVTRFDVRVGEPFADLTRGSDALRSVADVVAAAFRTPPMLAYTMLTAAALAYKGFRRTAWWVLAVMVGTSLVTTGMKILLNRDRPVYALLELKDAGFPSGHSSGIASAAGVAIVLAALFVRRRSQRRLVTVVAVLVAVAVGLDRLLLGVHGITDVITGWSLGALFVTAGLYLVDPTPRHRESEPLASPSPLTRQLAVILNPVKVEDPVAFKALVEERAAALGWDAPRWFETTIEDPGGSMAHDAAVGGADLVIVCGGDGTVRTVCAELAGTGVPVGVVPAGTGNLLARNLDLPLYLKGAVDVALSGQDRAIDLVRVTGDQMEEEHFLVMAGMGFDAAIMEGASEQIKAKVGWLAYVVSGLRNLMFPAVRVEVSVDGGPFSRHRARTIVVGNVGFLQAGLPLLPDATIDDGRIDVVLINPARFLSWLKVVVRVLSRGRKTDATVNRMTGRTIVVRAAHETPRQIDGDPIGAGRELVCECLPGKLLVRVPR